MANSVDFLEAASQGKFGLALSGGGFRAAFFHIGVLANLAEQDLLGRVAVISTVSGGSIIGAYYYLKVKELLEGRRRDGLQASQGAYIRLVREIETDFLTAVQQNMRMRTFLDRHKNARMMREGYSPTERIAELYTEHFYGPLWGPGRNILLRELPIERPATAGDDYPAPQLIINATALNTGHLWQFTGTGVGEKPSKYEKIDARYPLLEKLCFDAPTLTARQRAAVNRLTLGQAVAASCCVPGLFEPLALADLYQTRTGEEITVSLVDGGVFDNQGLVSLFGEQCTPIVCSDASDILKTQAVPSIRLINVAMRANDILMDRIRNKILDDLFSRDPQSYAFFHLGHPVGPEIFPHQGESLVYALSHIRTDLDSFTDLEAYTLMYYGYQLCARAFSQETQVPVAWNFLAIQAWLWDEDKRRQLLLHLQVGAKPFLKVFFLQKPLPYAVVATALLVPMGIIGFLLSLLPPLALAGLLLLMLSIVAYSQNARINQFIDKLGYLRRLRRRLALALTPLGIPMLIGLTGALITWVHLHIFDRLFLHYGRLKKPGSGEGTGVDRNGQCP